MIRIENEIVIFENVFKIIQGWSYERLCKINKELTQNHKKPLIYQFLNILVTKIVRQTYKVA
jgi:hypothetical protein